MEKDVTPERVWAEYEGARRDKEKRERRHAGD